MWRARTRARPRKRPDGVSADRFSFATFLLPPKRKVVYQQIIFPYLIFVNTLYELKFGKEMKLCN